MTDTSSSVNSAVCPHVPEGQDKRSRYGEPGILSAYRHASEPRQIVSASHLTLLLIAATLPIRIPGFYSVTFGLILAVGALVVSLPNRLSRSTDETNQYVILATLAAVFSGLMLSAVTTGEAAGRSLVRLDLVQQGLCLATAGGIVVAALLCLKYLGVKQGLAAFALGSIIDTLVIRTGGIEDIWKYGLGAPVVIMALIVVSGRSRVLQGFVALILAYVSIMLESRNLAGVLCVAALAAFVSPLLNQKPVRIAPGRVFVTITAAMTSVYVMIYTLSELIESGRFGSELAARQISQDANYRFLGGRVESGAFLGLFRENPLGFGLGVVPSTDDIAVGKQGLLDIGAGAGGDYVNNTMFGGRIELHSIMWDLWVYAGLVGLAIGIASLFIIIGASVVTIWDAATPAYVAVVYVLLQASWDIIFSPFYANYIAYALALALALYVIKGTRGDGRPRWILDTPRKRKA